MERGSLHRVRHGYYAESAGWSAAHAEERERALARTATDAARLPLVFSHITAAALHGLPLIDHVPSRAHVMARQATSGGSNAAVMRHRDRWDGSAVELDGFRVTSLARTVVDVARTCRRTTALACADAALRAVAAVPGTGSLDLGAAERLRSECRQMLADARAARGVRAAREIVELADPRAESPGESISRLHILDLGFDDVRVQVAIRVAGGALFRVDLGFAGVLGEFDGRSKYLDPARRGGRTAEQVLLDEKRREDLIRAATGQRVLRWGATEVATRDRFARFLASHGIRLPRARAARERQ